MEIRSLWAPNLAQCYVITWSRENRLSNRSKATLAPQWRAGPR
jgi:hypothetical protein